MIIEFFINAVVTFIIFHFSWLDNVSFNINYSVIDSFLGVVSSALYFFPWPYLIPIVLIIMCLQAYRIAISLIRLVVEFIPFM